MKILYVEDELSKNIPKIIRLFEKYLGATLVKELEELENDESGYGADPDIIKQCVSKSKIIQIEYNFTNALYAVTKQMNDFSLIIVDRDLSENDYDLKRIKKIIPGFTEDHWEKYIGREGDYIFSRLVLESFDVMNNFYFVTANSRSELRDKEEINYAIDYDKFSYENIIDKSDSRSIEKLRNRINQNSKLCLRLDNMSYLKFLEENIGKKAAESFFELLFNKHRSIGARLTGCRVLLENILTVLATVKEPRNSECWYYSRGDRKELKVSDYIRVITKREHKTYKYNSIIEAALENIKSISNEFGAHEDLTKVYGVATEDTVQMLIYSLKDIINWLDREKLIQSPKT